MSQEATVGQVLVGLLEERGVTTAFGIPGVHTIELYRGLARSSIEHVTPRHEQGASFMADGYASVTGRPALCVLITGPGLTNAATGIAQAHHDSRPLLVVSSSVASDQLNRGLGGLHDLPDQEALMRTICGFSETVHDPYELPALLRRAWDLFESERPRPVHLSIPIDVLAAPAPPLELEREVRSPRSLDGAAIAAAAERLSGAEQPMMVLGGGAVAAAERAADLARRVGSPILLSGNAKGAVPMSEPLSLGCALAAGPALDALREADVVLAVGTELSDAEQIGSGRELELPGCLIRVDIDPAQLQGRFPASVGIAGDAGEVLGAIADAISPNGDAAARALGRAAALRTAITKLDRAGVHGAWIDQIAANLSDDAIVAVDSTQLAYSMHESMESSRPRSWLAPYGFGTLGPALPMAIGAQVAFPDRQVVAIAGDGGALFTGCELATAAQHGLAITYVVWNSASYEEIRDAMERANCPQLGTSLNRVDFAAFGESLGCRGVSVSTPEQLGEAMARAAADDVATVIDVRPGD